MKREQENSAMKSRQQPTNKGWTDIIDFPYHCDICDTDWLNTKLYAQHLALDHNLQDNQIAGIIELANKEIEHDRQTTNIRRID